MPIKEERTKQYRSRADHEPSMVVPTVRGIVISLEVFCFLMTFRLSGSFIVVISHGCSTSRSFITKMVLSTSFQTHPSIPLSFLQVYQLD